jgi:hypothetical protein
MTLEFEDPQYRNVKVDTIWNTVRDKEMELTLTREELKRIREGQTREKIVKEGFWWMRPDDIAFRSPTDSDEGRSVLHSGV